MKSSIFNVVGDFFALDIGSSGIRVVQLRGGGNNRALVRYGSAPIESKTALSEAASDQQKVSDAVQALMSQSGITTKNVVVGIPSNKAFITIVDLPKLSNQELASTIKYQAEQFIPMSTDEAKIDWVVLGDSPLDPEKSEVLLASVTNMFVEKRMEMLEALGLNVIALEPDALALARSLSSNASGAQMIIDMGEFATDIIITFNGAPRLVRSIPTGGQTFTKSVMQGLSVDESQAKQFVYKFGLDNSKLEGQIYKALQSSAEIISTEVQKSLKFFASRYQNAVISQVITSGSAALMPGFHQYISTASGNLPVQPGNSWQNVSYSNNVHEQLMNINHQFAVASGLAQRSH